MLRPRRYKWPPGCASIEDGAELELFTKNGLFQPEYGSASAPDRD